MSNATRKHDYNAVYRYIVDYKRAHDGNSPTMRELARHFGLSTSIVKHILETLAAEGLLRKSADNVSRAYEVVGGSWTMP